MKPYYEHAGITIYHGDCREILPELGECADVLVTDPPYGIGYDAERYPDARFEGVMVGDGADFDPTQLLAMSLPSVLWGANNYAHLLPPGGWLCWDKRVVEAADRILGSPFELAWCSIRNRFKILRCQHGGAVNADGSAPRVHPTQKPLRVMNWSLGQLADDGIVLDPFMGSGTTLVAAKNLGREAVGIEIEEKYCEISAKRLQQEVLLFNEKQRAGVQGQVLADLVRTESAATESLPGLFPGIPQPRERKAVR